jgi:hypothetical protein
MSKTLEEICPKWAHYIKTGETLRRAMNIRDSRYCIVCEAHGWNVDYVRQYNPKYCEQCTEFAAEFHLKFPDDRDMSDMLSTINAFVAHWNDKHG